MDANSAAETGVAATNARQGQQLLALQAQILASPLLFASDAGKHITGQLMAVDGGASALIGG